jgi:hypothetical protein
MHLTNYAIQKRSEEFIRDEESGTKRYFTYWRAFFVASFVIVNKMNVFAGS